MKNTVKKNALCTAILSAMGTAHGATINVDNDCTLSEAIQTANSDLPVGTCEVGNGADVIQVVSQNANMTINTFFEASPTAPGDVGLPIINSEVTIEGNGLTLRSNHDNYYFRMFQVEEYGDLTLRNTTIEGADDGYGFGSGILVNDGRVTLENTTFALNKGALMLVGSYNSSLSNTVLRHNITGNSFPPTAAGITAVYTQLEINNSSIVNSRFQPSPGIPLFQDPNNPSPQVVLGGGPITPGGLLLLESDVTISDSTISKNQSPYGAGLTISGESGPPAIRQLPEFITNNSRGVISSLTTIKNSTITENKSYIAAGIFNYNEYATINLQGNIIAGNHEKYGPIAANILNAGGTINMDANNIIGDRGYPGTYGVTMGASDFSFMNDAEDNLYPLTLTNGQLLHPLKVGSAAIDANDLSCYGSILDQEGKGRGKDGNNDGDFICDIGSFEHTAPIIANDAPCTLQNAIISANNDASIGGCQPGKGHDIIILPENSTQSANSIADSIYIFDFGFNMIESAITIEGNDSTLTRANSAADNFDLLFVYDGGQLNLFNSTVTGANGNLGAITTVLANVNLVNSTVTQNLSPGVFDYLSINSSVIDSTISQNNYVPGVISSEFAAGLSSVYSTGFELRNSTISENTGYYTGGVDVRYGRMQSFENSTISGNFALGYGGMVSTSEAFGSFVNGLTITNNEATAVGGMIMVDYNPNPSGALIQNSIISGNTLTPPPPLSADNFQGDLLSAINSGQGLHGVIEPRELHLIGPNTYLNGNNILGNNNSPGTTGAVLGPSDQIPAGATSTVIDTNLADNGGNTLTHALVSGSIGIDSGDEGCGLNSDQVGNMRPWDGDGDNIARCDAGAVEYNSIPVNDIIFKDGFDPVIIMRSQPTKQ